MCYRTAIYRVSRRPTTAKSLKICYLPTVSPNGLHLGHGGSGIPSALTVGGTEMVVRNSAAANQSKHFFTMSIPFQNGLHRDIVLPESV